jgi:transposase
MVEGSHGGALIADKAYDSNAFREEVARAGMREVIPSSRTRKILISRHREISKLRNRIERRFNKLEVFQLPLNAVRSTYASSLSLASPPP